MGKKRKYNSIRRIEMTLPPEKADKLEDAKNKYRKTWGDFVWMLWEFWEENHPELTAD